MPDFEGANIVELQPLDVKVPVQFKVTVCTAVSTNDGFIPFGYTAATVTATAKKYPSSTIATSQLIDGVLSLSSSVITIPLTWPVSSSAGTSILGPGTYHITFKIGLTGGTAYREANFNRVFARDK
jgi:hypothetical protein